MSEHSGRPDWAEAFIVREMEDELLVYDLKTQRISSLNQFASQVWHASNGVADPKKTAAALAEEGLGVPPETIASALAMLVGAGLLDGPVMPAPKSANRRDFLGRMLSGGVAASSAAVVVPAVVTILAPTPAHAASCNCPPETPYCLPGTNECVQCLIDADCVQFEAEFCSGNECSSGGA